MKKHVLAMILLLIAMAIPAMAELKLPEGIREIGDQAFYGNPAIDAVVVPDGAERIGSEAFADCPNLSEITLPDSIQFIADDAFSGSDYVRVSANADSYAYEWAVEKGYIEKDISKSEAQSLFYDVEILDDGTLEITNYYGQPGEEIDIPESFGGRKVTSIGDRAFEPTIRNDRRTIKKIIIPEGVVHIGDEAFYNGTGWYDETKEIILPSTLESIGARAFCYLGIKNFEYPQKLKNCGWAAFGGNSITSYAIPEGVTHIPAQFFTVWSELKKVDFPDSLVSIGENAFSCSGLETITIPKSIQYVGYWAFSYCDELKEVCIEGDFLVGKSQSNYGIFYECNKLSTAIIREGVESLDDYLFHCSGLTEIQFPSTLKHIGVATFVATELKEIRFPDSLETIGVAAFQWCDKLTWMYLPPSIREIGEYQFIESDELIIYGEAGSYAESWAEENGFPFSTHYYEEVVLPKEAISLGGRVCLEDGSGLSGVKVTICYNKDIYAGSAETDSDGYWSCDGLRPNQEYTISYACSGYGIPVSTCVVKYKSMVLEDVIAAPNLAEAIRFEQPLHGQNVSPYEGLHLVWTPVEGAKYYEYSARYLDQEEAFIFRRKTELTEAWIPIPDMQEDNTLQLWVAAFVDSDDEMISNQIIRVTTNAPAEIPEHTCQWGEEYNVGESWYQKCTICGITIARTKPEAGDSVCAHGNLRSCCCICVGYHDWIRNENIDMGAGDSIFDWYCCMRCGESINSTASSDQKIYYCALEKIPQNGNPLDDSIVEEYLRNKMNGYVSNKNQTAILQALRKAPTVYQKLYLYSVTEYNYELTDGTMQYAHGKHVIRINEAKNSDTNEFLSVWFHEVGHAIDGNSGAANTYKTNDTAVIYGVEQNELFFYLMADAKTLIYKCINQIENDGSLGCTLTAEERERIASAILDPNQDKVFDSECLNNAMELLCGNGNNYGELQWKVLEYTYKEKNGYIENFKYINSQMAIDIWGGLTNLYVFNDGHVENGYWYKNGKPTYNQCHEAFAEYFSAQILGIDAIKNNNATVFPFGTNRMNGMCNELKEVYRKRHGIEA